ncbi:MAG TPA: malto-oligosyltrehalose synthase [Candidatus Limnocylindria bacterium]|nr:malto-oligosyltrehalose synthase [Candidatus Limnocylindria bacterium]
MTAQETGSQVPRATYRLQLNASFDFERAADVAPYLSQLGASHLYSSPILQTSVGSTHGYDVVDPRRVNSDLGGSNAWSALRARLDELGLGVVLDIVPNHLAITSDNPWWWDVLENGRSSRYAPVFDVDWQPPEPHLRDTILMPILGDHYGRELEAGHIRLEREGAHFLVTYFEHRLPLAPETLQALLDEAARRAGSDELAVLAEALGRLLPAEDADRGAVHRRHRDKGVLLDWLERLLQEQPDVARAVDAVVGDVDRDVERLDQLLAAQNYRLAFWRAAGRDLGYRRFFDITSLAGVRVEDEEVFEESHARVLGWLHQGALDGLRVDHPDGLRDPAEYFARIRAAAPRAWLVIEKILEPGERLRPWPVAGTTGYDFMQQGDGVFVNPGGEAGLSAAYEAFTGLDASLPEIVREAKLFVLDEVLGSELNRLTDLGLRMLEGHRRQRDHTRHDVHETLREICAALPVYRTYVRAEGGEVAQEDEAAVGAAVEAAREAHPELPADLLDFLADVLLLRVGGPLEGELAMRFQQLTGAVMAKGVEDTAFYRYNRLISLNEVGGDPGHFGVSPADFHAHNAYVTEHWPDTMLATSTHDTKRSEDVRARLHLISQMPGEWASTVERWAERNERHRLAGMPDRNTEWFLYQTLVGAWPIESERVQAAVLKAAREAKVHTSWTRPDEGFEEQLSGFIESLYEDREFRQDLDAFVAGLEWPGRLNSLALTLLKLTSPGVPDIYQGTELWDNSLVDPDNRRPVDFELRRRLLAELDTLGPEEVLARRAEGLPKLWTIRQALALRREMPAAFGSAGSYEPLEVRGERREQALAFLRGGRVATVVPRLNLHVDGEWDDTALELPAGTWRNALSGEVHRHAGGLLRLAELLARFPTALLVREGSR